MKQKDSLDLVDDITFELVKMPPKILREKGISQLGLWRVRLGLNELKAMQSDKENGMSK